MIQRCNNCLMMSTRPRFTLTKNGMCSACEWAEIKKTIDWSERHKELEKYCNEIRGKYQWDCIVPVSGGKDSTYVADKMKNEFNLNVLTVTITPPLETDIIQKDLNNFLEHGFCNIKVTPNPEITRAINKKCFIEQGRPLEGWISCVQSVMFRFATSFNIPLIMFGEEGESEYGGTTKLRYTPYYDVDYAIKVYTEGNDPRKYLDSYSEGDLRFWLYPSEKEMKKADFKVSHWSYFENWDTYEHWIFARDNYDMMANDKRNLGTYSNFGQIDTPLYILHAYMMYLKFGFGRCLQDTCIDIRAGRLTREQAIELVKKYDGEPIDELIPAFTDYFKMNHEEFWDVIKKHTNKDLFEWTSTGKLTRKFDIE